MKRPGYRVTGEKSCQRKHVFPLTHKNHTAEAEQEGSDQGSGTIGFDGRERYTSSGCVLEGGRYVRKTMTFTCAEAGVYPTEPPWRVCAMLDLVGRSPQRQTEIGRFGQRVWHSPYRPEGAALQGLDYIFRHDVDLVAACHPASAPFYAAEREQADRWTRAMADAYQAYVQQRDGAAAPARRGGHPAGVSVREDISRMEGRLFI